MKRNKMLFSKDLLILFLLLLLGSALRLQTLLTKSFAFTYDVGRDLIAVSEIATLQNFSLIGPTTGLPGVFYGPWWYWILTPFYIIFGGDPVGFEFAMYIAGMATIIISYIVGKKIGGYFLGICFAALIAVSPFQIYTSSQIWNPNVAPLFTALVLYYLFEIFFSKRRLLHFFLLGLFLALSFDAEIVYGALLTIGVIISVAFMTKLKISLLQIGAFLIGAILIFSPRIIFEFRHGFLMTNSLLNFLAGGAKVTAASTENLILKRLNSFNYEFCANVAGNNYMIGILLIVCMLGTLFFFRKKIEEKAKTFYIASFIIILTFFAGLLFFKQDLYAHYFAGLGVIFILIVALTLNLISTQTKRYKLAPILLFLIIFVNFNPITFITNLKKPIFTGDAAVYRNQLEVIDYVYSQANGKKFKYVVYTPPVHDYTYRYLFSWYGPKKYNYKSVDKSDLAFFILEPDHQSPERLSDWLKLRQDDGKIVKSTKLKSGIIVQTRTQDVQKK